MTNNQNLPSRRVSHLGDLPRSPLAKGSDQGHVDRPAAGLVAIGLNNLKTEANLGGVLRAAHCYGAAMVGVRGRRFTRQYTDTSKAYRHIPLLHTTDCILRLCPFNCVPVAIELVEKAIPLPEFAHPRHAFYVVGAEDQTLGRQVLDRCKYVVTIPTAFCMNLAATVNVVLYDRLAKDNTNAGCFADRDCATAPQRRPSYF